MNAVAEERETLGQRLKRLRGKTSQVALAIKARVSPSIVAKIEQEDSADPKLSTLRALASALGVGLEELAGPSPAP